MHVLVADSLPETAIDALEARGHRCEVDPPWARRTSPTASPAFDILVVRSTKVTEERLRGRGPARAGHPRRGRDEHHRHGRRGVPGACSSPTCPGGTPPPWPS